MIKAFEIPNFKFDKNKLKDVYLNNKSDWAKRLVRKTVFKIKQ